MSVNTHKAIYALYPEVTNICDLIAVDKNGKEVKYDQTAVETKAFEIQAQELAEDQAKIDNKQSALAKLMKLGLTEEEALALAK
jgi:hypothetical protein